LSEISVYWTFMSSKNSLDGTIRDHIGAELRALYGDTSAVRIPKALSRLITRVTQVIRAHQQPLDPAFIDELMAALPGLRAFAISLTRSMERAEDLVQETVLRAISRQESFELGTNLQAWLTTILRNCFYSLHRQARREVEDSDGSYAASLVSLPEQEGRVTFGELQLALAKLPQNQREALLLVGLEGTAYDDAAEALGVKIGTIKSRVNRARVRLAELMGLSEDEVGEALRPAD
jgi:RNA polymerase sigma-70 factor (ECF subfamily)